MASMKVSFVGKPAAAWYQSRLWWVLGRLNMMLRVSLGWWVLLAFVVLSLSGSRFNFHNPVSLHQCALRTGGSVVEMDIVVAS